MAWACTQTSLQNKNRRPFGRLLCVLRRTLDSKVATQLRPRKDTFEAKPQVERIYIYYPCNQHQRIQRLTQGMTTLEESFC